MLRRPTPICSLVPGCYPRQQKLGADESQRAVIQITHSGRRVGLFPNGWKVRSIGVVFPIGL